MGESGRSVLPAQKTALAGSMTLVLTGPNLVVQPTLRYAAVIVAAGGKWCRGQYDDRKQRYADTCRYCPSVNSRTKAA